MKIKCKAPECANKCWTMAGILPRVAKNDELLELKEMLKDEGETKHVLLLSLYPIFSGRRWHTHGAKCLISGNDDARLTRAGMSEGMCYPLQQTSAEGFFASAQGISFFNEGQNAWHVLRGGT